ncbi:sigma-54 interaction domain-containing protein [Aliagarivorans marinus]|uniref:sigma-54 interaction domain-containing protein n=1 Tax=Aliagarivorans marinus TaxID=561965 RepID=UPI000428FDBA|nr:sigma-54 dependent transcriptional regulator [Aliagarivorans marinus]
MKRFSGLALACWQSLGKPHSIMHCLQQASLGLAKLQGPLLLQVLHFDRQQARLESLSIDGQTANPFQLAISKPASLDALTRCAEQLQTLRNEQLPEELSLGLAQPTLLLGLGVYRQQPYLLRLSLASAIKPEPSLEQALQEVAEPLAACLKLHLDSGSHVSVAPLEDSLGGSIVGAEGGLAGVVQQVKQLASVPAPVMLMGESGSGKEVIARALHSLSTRAEQPFIRCNCGAIPPELIDSQLFGHEKGAFTGATSMHRGWFERANGGTLLLDEVAELPLAAQVRLLRVLQDGWVERVGGQAPFKVDVRIVAATHRNVPQMIAEGRFREDLWYRLAVFPLSIPPLRERLQDLPELISHFAAKSCKRFGLPPLRLAAEDLLALQGYHWPGNVRELASVIDRAALLAQNGVLNITAALGVATLPADTAAHATGCPSQTNAEHVWDLNEVNRRHIQAALLHCQGVVEGTNGAAQLLGLNPNTLRARMKKLGVDWRAYK